METASPIAPRHTPGLLKLTLGSIGVVYGDIGTSPLYAFRESLHAMGKVGQAVDPGAVLGLLSLVLWTLLIIVTFKYVLLLLRADNHGEGGILSLMTLARSAMNHKQALITMLGMAGAALFYGDAMITPAISVLSALEGLDLVTHHFRPYVLPAAIVIMVLLFIFQRGGTAKVANFFGPIMMVWFGCLAYGGLRHISESPAVWNAFNPLMAVEFLIHHGYAGVLALGAVFLTVTGAEALYADLGHFGKRPIRLAWLWVVMPALMLNYLGQAALVLHTPAAAEDPFFLLYPGWALMPMVLLATVATVIASQAVITGAYSLTHQAIQLGFLPRLTVEYTSESHAGQIYLPQVNWLLLGGVLLLIALFRTSDHLASAYGIAVTGTMVITATLILLVARYRWHWPWALALLVILPLLALDLVFLGANLTKFMEGGFVPVLLSLLLMMSMRIWVRGNNLLSEQMKRDHLTIESLMQQLTKRPLARVDGTAIFLTSNVDYAPSALLHNIKHNRVLHKHNVLLTLRYAQTPYVSDDERVSLEQLDDDFSRVYMTFGYMEPANVIRGLRLIRDKGLKLDMMSTTFFISRRNIVPSSKYGMPVWQDRIFIALSNNASDAADYFHLPRSRIVELGVQMCI